MESKDINFEKPEDFKKNMKEQKFENLSRIEAKVFS